MPSAADLFVVSCISIGVQYARLKLRGSFSVPLRSRAHPEVEHHAFTRRTVLPQVGSVILASLVLRLHADWCFIGLDVTVPASTSRFIAAAIGISNSPTRSTPSLIVDSAI